MTKRMTRFEASHGFIRKDWDDVDSPEATNDQLAQGKPFAKAFPELAATIRGGSGRPALVQPKNQVTKR